MTFTRVYSLIPLLRLHISDGFMLIYHFTTINGYGSHETRQGGKIKVNGLENFF